MKLFFNPHKALSIILFLVSLHSLFIGIGLLVLPDSLMSQMGFYNYQNNFFRYQGGVFHLVMSFAYALSAYNSEKYFGLIILTLIAKFSAFLFLFLYYFLEDKVMIVLISGICDFVMGLVVLYLVYHFKNQEILINNKK